MTLEQFLDVVSAPARSLVVVNRSAPDPIQRMLESAFEGQPVDVDERDLPDTDSDLVLLVEETDTETEVVASSPVMALQETILLVNSDLYKTGTRRLREHDLPDVLTRLDDISFRLRGYPESDTEKLLLIAISRYIERRAYQTDGGMLRASFQRLSRINDERGTRTVYETLADSPVQTHVYGVPDWQPPTDLELITHGGHTADFQDSWFVVYTPPAAEQTTSAESQDAHAALLALEVAPREWEGFWTFRPSLVVDINEYIATNL